MIKRRMLLAGLCIAASSGVMAEPTVNFKGTLQVQPCELAPGRDGENVEVDFGTISEKTFYSGSSPRTGLQPFHILLTECDPSLTKEVRITFTGAEDSEQPGLLALTSASGVAHIAVGLQTSTGTDLPLNKQTPGYALTAGSTQLSFKAYIQASDEGVSHQSVGRGTFRAVSTFELEYP
ncbi:type 1 fimbrial protein (plasmid) [Pantoea agglomerans]|uniref:fimbrial protein n=1 Tax=Enterobacter agglomerans TaxID=549 RepID=UPI001A9E50BE|nr:fimbrial protein [Pantoea agglomerans]QTC48647.1 type 1 fimbrial protein [Pantoea agglomerans]